MPEPGKPAVIQCAPEDPAYLFAPENYPNPSYLRDKFLPALGGFIGFVGMILNNYGCRRPAFSGLPVIAGATVAGTAIGVFVQNRNDAYFAERDAVYRHYMSLHPEDFPAKERLLIGDMMKTWVPIR